MKTRTRQRLHRFQLKLTSYGNSYYIKRISKLERVLARRPRELQIDLVGVGEIPADLALLLRSVLIDRCSKTQLITNARSSLRGGSVLVWLMGERRMIRNDARIYFRKLDPDAIEIEPGDAQKDGEVEYRDSFSAIDPEEGDYAQVLQVINEFLPVKELAGRLIGVPVLRQFGLIENEQVDGFLASAFAKSEPALIPR